ncbi:MAG: hypothetical protein NDI81_00755 [Desulfobacula sp.]|nr:hypothetical protein [Desulfobacula sp.]
MNKLDLINRLFFAIVFFGLSVTGAFYFPVLKSFLIFSLVGYSMILLKFPRFWIFFLPAFLPLVNTAPWSGHVLYEEFDLFILATISIACWKGYYRIDNLKTIDSKIIFFCFLFFLSVSISFVKGLSPVHSLTPDDFSNYLSHYNSVRVARSFIWALLLFPLLHFDIKSDHRIVTTHLFSGFAVGLVGVCIIVFWERGIIWDLLNGSSRYDYFRSLLDFSSEYRTTALFSDMNTGGSAIDDYVSLSWAFGLGIYLKYFSAVNNKWSLKHILIGCLVLIPLFSALYVIGTTFTRITYLSFGASAFIFIIGWLVGIKDWVTQTNIFFYLAIILFWGLITGIFFFLYGRGGYISIFAGASGVLGGVMLGGASYYFPRLISIAGGVFIFMGSIFLMVRAMITSRWTETPLFEACIISMIVVWILFSISTGLGRIAALKKKFFVFISIFFPILFVLSLTVPMVSGKRMQTRFSESQRDAGTRFAHYKNVLNVMDTNMDTFFRGMGVGSFPRNFIKNNEKASQIGTYHFVNDGESFLRLKGGKDMAVGQRLLPGSLTANGRYALQIKARTNTPDSFLSVGICSRNLMDTTDCKFHKFSFKGLTNQWVEFIISIEENQLKNYKWYSSWPRIFSFYNLNKDVVIDIKDVRLYNDRGENALSNGTFEKGGQRWFSYNEHEHLPWHIKNMMLHLYYEQGMLGLVGFILLLLYAFWKTWPGVKNGQLFSSIIATSLTGITIAGLTGCVLDSPRVALLYYLVLFTALSLDTKRMADV